jgi:glycosyltransferase involved in cell wall biosynthesis
MNQLALSVVVPTYNRYDTLAAVLPTLLDQTLPAEAYEVIVADSMSTDRTPEFMREQQRRAGERLRYLPGAYNGRAAARNAGIAAANAPVILFTDADILASPVLFERHVQAHAVHGNARIALVGCELQVRTLADYRTQRDDPGSRKPLHPSSRHKLTWLYFLTGNASVRKADLLAVGGFDEAFTGYGHEDLELGYRLARSGVDLLYDAQAVNFHWHPVGFAEQVGRMELAGVSTVRFYRKHKDFSVKANLGMTFLSLWLHSALTAAPGLRRAFERAGAREEAPRKNTWPYIARQIAYQYHYVSGIKKALRDGGPAA